MKSGGSGGDGLGWEIADREICAPGVSAGIGAGNVGKGQGIMRYAILLGSRRWCLFGVVFPVFEACRCLGARK